MGRSKKATQATQAAKKRRNKAKRQTRGTNPIANASFPDSRAMVLSNPFDATTQRALIELAPKLTVEEYHTLRDTGHNPKPDEYDLVDPTLTRMLTRRREWESYEDGTWDHVPNQEHVATAWGEFAQPLHIAVGFTAADGPRWEIHHPSPDDDFRAPAETYTSRDTLLAELDRLEHLGHPADTYPINSLNRPAARRAVPPSTGRRQIQVVDADRPPGVLLPVFGTALGRAMRCQWASWKACTISARIRPREGIS